MTPQSYLNFHNELTEKAKALAARKSHDYAGSEDVFKNFRLCQEMGITSVEKGFMVRLGDKFARLSNVLEGSAKVSDETVEDTLVDIINYTILLAAYLTEKKGQSNAKPNLIPTGNTSDLDTKPSRSVHFSSP